jgi:hypothetical protein
MRGDDESRERAQNGRIGAQGSRGLGDAHMGKAYEIRPRFVPDFREEFVLRLRHSIIRNMRRQLANHKLLD